MKEMERLRWRCRRGLLELDIVLERFVSRHYAGLDAAQMETFGELLDMPDTELWDMIAGKTAAPQDSKHRAMVELLRVA